MSMVDPLRIEAYRAVTNNRGRISEAPAKLCFICGKRKLILGGKHIRPIEQSKRKAFVCAECSQ